MRKLKQIKGLITNTPLVDITYSIAGVKRHVYAKCEWYSLTGSVKDKTAYQIFYDAIRDGRLKAGDNVVEVSSGNMGISICAMANLLGLHVTIIMPKNMSEERKKLIKLYGATLVEANDFAEAFTLANEYIKKGYFSTNQFANNSNAKVHMTITANEIYSKIKNTPVSCFVSGVGTSGTLTGIGGKLKKKLHLKIIAIEPDQARILSKVEPYLHHKIQGISDEIVPALYNENLVDKIIPIKDDDAIAMAQKLCKCLSLGVGISSGANFLGCVLCGASAVTIFPDDNKKYLSTDLSTPVSTPLVDKIKLLDIRII